MSNVKGVESKGDCLAVVDERIGPGDSVGDEQVDEVSRREAGIRHTREDHVDGGPLAWGRDRVQRGTVALGRPAKNWRRGAPGQFETATAPAN